MGQGPGRRGEGRGRGAHLGHDFARDIGSDRVEHAHEHGDAVSGEGWGEVRIQSVQRREGVRFVPVGQEIVSVNRFTEKGSTAY